MPALGRLTKRPEYLRVAGGRRKWVTPGLVVQALLRREAAADGCGGDAPVRLGITVSRKVGNAVQRNRARRRIRAAAQEVLPEAGRPGYDYVVIGRKATLTRSYADLVDDLRTAVRRLNSSGRDGKARSGAGRHDRADKKDER